MLRHQPNQFVVGDSPLGQTELGADRLLRSQRVTRADTRFAEQLANPVRRQREHVIVDALEGNPLAFEDLDQLAAFRAGRLLVNGELGQALNLAFAAVAEATNLAKSKENASF